MKEKTNNPKTKKKNPTEGKMTYEEGAVMKSPGSAAENLTGTWRTFRPRPTGKCTGCGICAMYCPEGGVKIVEKNGKKTAEIDLAHCKGCLICIKICPYNAMDKEMEK